MKRSTKSFTKISNLYESVHQQVKKCSIAAVVAVVSLLALMQPSEAKIVYTPVNIQIQPNQTYNLDLNHDGITDFNLQVVSEEKELCYPWPPFTTRYLQETPAQGGGATDDTNGSPTALEKGAEIGPKLGFNPAAAYMAYVAEGYWRYSQTYCAFKEDIAGNWIYVTDRYLGLEFKIHGKLHFGWARLSVHVFSIVGHQWILVELTDYAYETIAGKSIKAGQKKEATDDPTNDDFGSGASLTSPIPDAPQPASLGILAVGAYGFPLLRRKESAVEGDLKGALL